MICFRFHMPKGRSNRGGGARGGGGPRASNQSKQDVEKLTKQEKAVAKYLYEKVGSKKAVMYGNNMLYFSGARAVACLMESKFAQPNTKHTLFTTRRMASDFCQNLLSKNVFHHVNKTIKRPKRKQPNKTVEEETKTKKSDSKNKDGEDSKIKSVAKPGKTGDSSIQNSPNLKEAGLRRRKGDAENDKCDEKTNKDEKLKDESVEKQAEKPTDEKEEKTKKRKLGKVLLDLHQDQSFIDDQKEYYVWVFEVTSIWRWLIGCLLIIGTIVICLFPLWPDTVRRVAWYGTSTVAMSLLGFITFFGVLRLVVYSCVFGATRGKCRFWVFPNLFAEVGFFESFQPFYASKWTEKDETKKEAGSDKDDDDDDEEPRESEDDENKQNLLGDDNSNEDSAAEVGDKEEKPNDQESCVKNRSKTSSRETSEENDFEMVNV